MGTEKLDNSDTKSSSILGRFDGRVHIYPLHIFYEDTDFSGIVYHANYLRFFERARSSFLNLLGIKHADLWDKHEMAFTIRTINLNYKRPARVDDQLEVRTTYDKITGARLLISQTCFRGDEELVSANCEAACITATGRPVRAPAFLKEKLETFLS